MKTSTGPLAISLKSSCPSVVEIITTGILINSPESPPAIPTGAPE